MITYTHILCVNEYGDIIHSLRKLFHLYGAHFISIGLKFKSPHYLGADYNSQDPLVLPSHHWILVVLHGPSIHLAVAYAFDPGEKIYLLPKKNIPLDISILFGAVSTPAVHHFWYLFSCPFLREDFPHMAFPLSSAFWT